MPPTLETPGGRKVDVPDLTDQGAKDRLNAEFERVMTDTPDDSPPRRTPTTADGDGAASRPRTTRAKSAAPKETKATRARTASAPSTASSSADVRAARVEGAKALHAIAAGAAALAGKLTGQSAFLADSLVISAAADDGAQVLADTADADPRFAAVLDRLTAVGPYGALITYGLSLGSQLLRNHKPGLTVPGTVHPSLILATVAPPADGQGADGQGAELAAAA